MSSKNIESNEEDSTKFFSLYAMNRFLSFIEEKEAEVQGVAIIVMTDEFRMHLVNEIIYRTREEIEIGKDILKGMHYSFEEVDIEKTKYMLECMYQEYIKSKKMNSKIK
ncbi:hypothetical protein SAMN05216516_11216 [Izhakiella capsodis]|uniref:Uncharacterized protein n=1 Tax=Izhakiella capsodis TaxID=1367852 RepID=A0A1I5AHW5_9GAMM|nr:hypothetical protein [Izhakiella capsodis]SFN62027.1 hypothetical protein SAMN05216516_11216 [Izhakiella capsodis]